MWPMMETEWEPVILHPKKKLRSRYYHQTDNKGTGRFKFDPRILQKKDFLPDKYIVGSRMAREGVEYAGYESSGSAYSMDSTTLDQNIFAFAVGSIQTMSRHAITQGKPVYLFHKLVSQRSHMELCLYLKREGIQSCISATLQDIHGSLFEALCTFHATQRCHMQEHQPFVMAAFVISHRYCPTKSTEKVCLEHRRKEFAGDEAGTHAGVAVLDLTSIRDNGSGVSYLIRS